MAAEFEVFLRLHKVQLTSLEVPERYWSNIHRKITEEKYDAGEYFSIAKDEDGDWHVLVSNENGVQMNNPNTIFLVDHAWTFQEEQAKKQLRAAPNLLMRMANLMECAEDESEETPVEILVERVMEKIWQFCQTYKVAKIMIKEDGSVQVHDDPDQKITLWYIMDEFGSRFYHSDEPNMAFKLFFHVPTQMSFTLIYPIKDIEFEEEATRNYIPEMKDDLQRDAQLYPWFPDRLNLEEVTDDWLSKIDAIQHEDRCNETLSSQGKGELDISGDRTLRVFTEREEVKEFLTHPRFVLHDDESTADILWFNKHFKDFESLADTPGKVVNQFPSENILTCKDLIAEVSMRSCKLDGHEINNSEWEDRGPCWLPTTFNLYNELPQFIKHFKQREERNLNNVWMCKPWNLARGLEHTITDNLNQIIRVLDSGPKVACKYLDDSVLFHRDDIGKVKFDVRYMVLLNSVEPLKLYAYKIFYTRFANIAFSLTDFEEYQKHLTVMNYRGADLKQIHWNDFIEIFEKQYPDQKWSQIESETFEIIKTLFRSAVSRKPPNGIGHNPQCRAMYGLDFMYKWKDKDKKTIQPMLIEANFNACIERCCKYQPHIVNDFFETMFLDQTGPHMVRLF
eukprot:Seg3007.3 transcript_id=Seg3007.3/GoldUCD/mRNA.D3Y31 product="Tubulin-tyrosine ligase-like protein 12" protein_id=Seg3007.3/GoldUCD/D3Y31